MRTLITQQPVDLIVWWETPDNTGLDEDLAGVWRQFPKLPVMAILDGSSAVVPSLRAQSYSAVIPSSDAEGLLQALNQRFSDSGPVGDTAGDGAGELAVRKILAADRQTSTTSKPDGLIQAAGTSISAEERALLREDTPQEGSNRPGTWLRRLLRH